MLHVHGHYRLLQATVAIDRSSEKKCFQVPAGALVLVNSFERDGPLVEVLYGGHRLLMFEEDIVQRAQPVEEHRPHH